MKNYVIIPVKRECVRLSKQGYSSRQIYENYYSKHYSTSYEGFRSMLKRWKHKSFTDDILLESANLDYEFKAHDSTVQVNGKGEIIQAWIKQSTDEDDKWDKLIEAIREDKEVITIEQPQLSTYTKMLEIPLFDMHFGVCDINYYFDTLDKICNIITKGGRYEEINIIIGQDLLHNDDFEGRTTKGTQIEKVDIVKAWSDALKFYSALIITALEHSNKTKLIYSKGNHDKSMSWAFTQLIKAKFPQLLVDDRLVPRKVINWNGCFIGFSHAEYKKSNANDLFQQFVLEFPGEFANASVRELHCGHLHTEIDTDKGMMIRRLPTGNKTDEWSSNEGFIGSHKRFMLFEYCPNWLNAIYYV